MSINATSNKKRVWSHGGPCEINYYLPKPKPVPPKVLEHELVHKPEGNSKEESVGLFLTA